MGRLTLKIDGRDIQTWQGATILDTALENKIYIPHLCSHPDLKPVGSCRVCMVELDTGQVVASCRTPVREGMNVQTASPEIDRIRRPTIEMIIANHHMDCRNCLKKGQCALQKIMAHMKIDKKKLRAQMRLPETGIPVDDSNPFFIRDHNKCVLCGICVRTCQEIMKINAIDFAGRGNSSKIAAFGDRVIARSKCISCGECVIRCPVGALALKNPAKPLEQVKSVCPYCGVGCGISLGIREDRIVHVKGNPSSQVNSGLLCAKGRFGTGFVHSSERIKEPLLRKGSVKGKRGSQVSPVSKNSGGGFIETTWDKALTHVAEKLKKYKGGEFALIASTKCTNEDNYIAQKFARVVMGSNNIDTSARLSYGPNIAAFRRTGRCVGFDSPSECAEGFPGAEKGSPDEIEKAACILVAGADITGSHPILGLKIKNAMENAAKLLVINPYENEFSRCAEKWLKPYPGTELAVIMGMCNVIVEEELVDHSFVEMYCKNFEEFREAVGDFSLGRVERITGVPRDLIEDSARIYASSNPAAIFWGQGVTQYGHGTDIVYSLINLALLTGQIRHPLALNPISDQSNTLGACDMGCLPDYYPCYQPVGDPDIREKFESFWDCTLNQEPGLTFQEIIEATRAGKIKALYIMGSDPASTIAPSQKVREALKKAEFVVFQDLFLNETAQYAHVILPAASFAEKEGTVINTEGKAQRLGKALEPLGNSRPDWAIFCELADRLESSGFGFERSEAILSEIVALIQYLPEKLGAFKLFPMQYSPPAEKADMEYPLLMTTEKDIYSHGVLSEKTKGLVELKNKAHVLVNPKDADDFEITEGALTRIVSRHGAIETEARITSSTPAGLVVTHMDQAMVNQILNPALDTISKTPEMKICAVRIEKAKKITKRQKTREAAVSA